jgi:hypothetical protein
MGVLIARDLKKNIDLLQHSPWHLDKSTTWDEIITVVARVFKAI